MRARVAAYASNARGVHSSGLLAAPCMGGLDQHTRPALYFVVRDRSMPRRIRLRRQGFAHFPFAKMEAVAQYELQRLFGRASGVAGKFLQAALLGRAKKQRGHGQLPVQLVYSSYHSRLYLSETPGYSDRKSVVSCKRSEV